MAEHMNLYQKASYYDVIFDRDIEREIEFLLGVYRHHVGREPESVLELACGPGYHARAFSERGLSAAGLDLSEPMIRMARAKSEERGIEVKWIVGDMREFCLEGPVDLAFVMFDGLDALLSNDDLLLHFQSTAENLKPDGMYVVDLTHPRDCNHFEYGQFHYAGERDGVRVEIDWATNEPQFDLVTGVAEVEIQVTITEAGQVTTLQDRAFERMLLPQEIKLLARLSNAFEVVAWYGDYNVGAKFDMSPSSRRMIAALKSTSAASG